MFLTTYINQRVSGNDTKSPKFRGLVTHVLTHFLDPNFSRNSGVFSGRSGFEAPPSATRFHPTRTRAARSRPDGRHYRRVVQGFQRIFAATIFFGTQNHSDSNRLIDSSRFHFFDRIQLWFTLNSADSPVAEDFAANTITLSEAFYDEINKHRTPVERHAVAAFAHAPGLLDFYIWLVWKCWSVRHHGAHVPLFSVGGLVNQLGTDEYSRDRFFRRKINFWLRQVKALWPECPARVSSDGNYLQIPPSNGRSPVRSTFPKATRFHSDCSHKNATLSNNPQPGL